MQYLNKTKITISWRKRAHRGEEHYINPTLGSESFILEDTEASPQIAFRFGFYYDSGHVDGSFDECNFNNGSHCYPIYKEDLKEDNSNNPIQNTVEEIVKLGNLKHVPDTYNYSYHFEFDMA